MDGSEAFTALTRRLLAEKRVNGLFVQCRASSASLQARAAFDVAFAGKTARKAPNRQMSWADWLVESLFPKLLYEENGQSLERLVKDPRAVGDVEGFSGKDNWNNSFGRMARPRAGMPEGFVKFMLDRWRGKYRSIPVYYFDVEYPEWVCEPLSGRPDIPKTGRTSVSCVMNYGFHWLNDEAHISVIVRHMNWSHGWGDIFGGHAVLAALSKELGGIPIGNVNVYANSASMDEPKIARTYLKEIERNDANTA